MGGRARLRGENSGCAWAGGRSLDCALAQLQCSIDRLRDGFLLLLSGVVAWVNLLRLRLVRDGGGSLVSRTRLRNPTLSDARSKLVIVGIGDDGLAGLTEPCAGSCCRLM